jgi:hypothetical protein
MSFTVVVHISNEDPILADMDELPAPSDTIVLLHHPRRRDGKDVHYLQGDVMSVIWPINQISFIEVLPGEGEEKIIGFVRD